MFLFGKQSIWSAIIAKTGFFTSLISYLLFALTEIIRPGFASRYFSIHFFLLITIVFGFWWSSQIKTFKDHWLWQYICAIVFSLIFFLIAWHWGQGFAEYRILMALLSASAPIIFLRSLRI